MTNMTDGTGPAPTSTTEWRDRKRYLWLIGLVMPALAFVAVGGHAWTGWSGWLWIGPLVVLGIVPVVDLLVGVDRSNPPDEVIAALEADRYYRWITYLFLPLQYAGLVAAFWVIANGDLSTADKVGLAVTMGFLSGIGINTAHELGHKREPVERWMAKIALAPSCYGHFYIEHNRGHHVRVATPEDPASSRMGESFYAFWPRTVFGSLRSAWRLEKRRYARRQQGPFRLDNDVLNAWLLSAALWAALVAWLGVGILPYLALQAVLGFTLLELVNYLEHYGMLRQRVGAPGKERYERVEPTHSWNANNIATNVLLYHLQRHSDHHANPTRRYQALRDYEDAPQLPTGYAGMILDRAGARVVAQGHGSARPGPLPRGRLAGEPLPSQAREAAGPIPGPARSPRPAIGPSRGLRRHRARRAGPRGPLPRLRLCLRRVGRRRARGLRTRNALVADPGHLVLPRLRGPRQGRLHLTGDVTFATCPGPPIGPSVAP